MKNEISNILNLIETGNTIKALEEAKTFHSQHKNNLDGIKLLAYTYIQLGNFEKVISILEDGYKSRKDQQDFDYFNNLGYALLKVEEFKKSIFNLERAIKINSSEPGVFISMAELYIKCRNFDEAIKYIEKALEVTKKIGPSSYIKYANLYLLMSEVNSALKQDTKSISMFNDILNKEFNENIFFLLANIDPKSVTKNHIDKAEDKLSDNEKKFKNKIDRFNYVVPIHFGLGMSYQSIDKAKSESYFDLGNDEIFNNTRYNSHQYQERIVKTMELYIKKYKNFKTDVMTHGEKNFFIVGTPRSGTTLVESIISANSQVFSGGELASARQIIEKNVLSKEQSLSGLSHQFVSKYLRRTSFLRGSSDYIVDKMPENFLYLGIISKLLTKSKIIRIFRDPWDTAISLYKQRYVLNIPYSVSFFNIGVFLANFEAINIFWNKNINDKSNILDIKYEELVSDKKKNQEKIYSFCNISSEYDEEKRSQFFSPTASIRQIKQGIHKKSIDKKEFLHHKDEFLDALLMQRQYWFSKDIIPKNDDFFGYKLK
jgi:tetratricopeptide (TPR) repeat protein